ncbi:MAG TPA: hypothetical protein PLW02_09520 [Verrucomicrobiota bacterium]|nr:hypothetical protein [Verrucomicrobiota bacterium]
MLNKGKYIAVLILLIGSLNLISGEAKNIKLSVYNGWKDSIIIEVPEAEVEAAIVPAIGGRIMRYELYGDNPLYENRNASGQTYETTGQIFFVGGYQCDLGPEIRDTPASPILWLGKWDVKGIKEHSVTLASQPDNSVGVQMEKEIVVDLESGELGIIQRIINISNKEITASHWDRTFCKSGGFILIPLSRSSKLAAGWSMRHKIQDKYIYDGINPSAPNVKIYGRLLVAKAEGVPLKIGADTDAGWIAYILNTTVFVKYFPVERGGNYPDSGNNVFAYMDDRLVEFGPVSAQKNLKAGAKYDFPEKWSLIQLNEPANDFKKAKSAADKISPSPFSK